METTNPLLTSVWTSPSNIALVKYWGKLPVQIPANASISFTLKESLTKMSVEAFPKAEEGISLDFFFEQKSHEKFKEKIVNFLEKEQARLPWILTHHLVIRSENTFPHSSGIASSASSMSALCLCLLSLDEKITSKYRKRSLFFQEASELSRLASGSAGRSIYPFMSTWGETSKFYASPLEKSVVHPLFHHYCDSILIVDEEEKSVSSRAGHALMQDHPFKESRYKRAEFNFKKLLIALQAGDQPTFIEVVEEEALMLHALMMTSTPSYILLKPTSLFLIEKIREYRKLQNIPVCFTIDAGPNIHLLYPFEYKEKIKKWLTSEFPQLRVIHDEVGAGPLELKD